MQLLKRLNIDTFLLVMIGTVVIAALLPVSGEAAKHFSLATKVVIALLFFLYGARLAPRTVVEGLVHWRLHLVVFAGTFALFPLLGLLIGLLSPAFLPPAFAMGIMFLCVLPSTIQSSIAFTSIAGGNIPAAICSASASNILGMFITPLLVALLVSSQQGGVSLDSMGAILLQMLVPFMLGQFLQRWIGGWLIRNKTWLGLFDRSAILMVVYLAFSAAVVSGAWEHISAQSLAVMVVVDSLLLAVVLMIITFASRLLNFSREDEITIVFCGSKKSMATGVPMAQVLFAGGAVGPAILPLMVFHQIQLMVCAVMAHNYARREQPRDETVLEAR
jgi:sodium/bile acid cotransporter 7